MLSRLGSSGSTSQPGSTWPLGWGSGGPTHWPRPTWPLGQGSGGSTSRPGFAWLLSSGLLHGVAFWGWTGLGGPSRQYDPFSGICVFFLRCVEFFHCGYVDDRCVPLLLVSLSQYGGVLSTWRGVCVVCCYPIDYSLPGSSVHGIFQARILEWVAIPFSRVSLLRNQIWVSCIARRFFNIWATRQTHTINCSIRTNKYFVQIIEFILMKIIQSEEQNLSDLGDTIKYGKKSINYELLIDTTSWINSNSIILRGKNKTDTKSTCCMISFLWSFTISKIHVTWKKQDKCIN